MNNRTRTLTAVAATALLQFSLSYAQQSSATATLTGRVVDGTTGEPIVGATVQVVGAKLGAYTNVSGAYTIRNLPTGLHSLKVTSVGYGPKTIENVKVDGGRGITQDISLVPQAIQGKEVVITADAGKQTENAALIERKRSTQVSDAISAQEISKAPAADAGDAMKRVTGVSVVGGRYVVVRGLSERYSATQLNGVNLPSPEPEKKVVPFDLFPASMINRLTTVKTFTPDNPGDFAGGLVKITTKEFPESFLLNLNVGSGINSETQGADALEYRGGADDFFGYDDGTRGLPEGISIGRLRTHAEQSALLARFNNGAMTPVAADLPVNQSYGLSVGNQFDVGFPIGFLLSGTFSNNASYRTERQAYPLLEIENGRRELRYDYDVRRAERSTLLGGLFNLSAQFAPEHKISFKGVYNHSSDDETQLVEGEVNQSSRDFIRHSRLRFVERALWSTQLDGEHKLEGVLNSRVEWRASIAGADRTEPDNRTVTYLRDEDAYRFKNNFGSNNGRFFSTLDDRENNFGLDWSLPFSSWNDRTATAKIGGLVRMRDRDFAARRFLFSSATGDREILSLPPEQLLSPENVAAGYMNFNDETGTADAYTAAEQVTAGFAMVDIPLSALLRFVGGVRMEKWHTELNPLNQLTGESDPSLAVDQTQTDLLPSANLIYTLTEEMNLRGSFSQTLARPEFRELAPFRYDDYRQSTYGNPSLERTKIMNYDLRWEWFPRGGEVVATSLFYKSFSKPIEQVYLVGGSDISVEPANASRARSLGAEFEIRKALDFLTPELENLSIGTNLTLVSTEVKFNEGESLTVFDGVGLIDYSAATLTDTTSGRPLQGQSPYVLNLSLGYDQSDWGTSVALLYNLFGRRLAIVGSSGIPDTYEESRGALDMTITQRLPAGLQLKISGRNLLDDEVLLRQEFPDGEQIDVERYRTGRSFSIGIGFSFDQYQLQTTPE